MVKTWLTRLAVRILALRTLKLCAFGRNPVAVDKGARCDIFCNQFKFLQSNSAGRNRVAMQHVWALVGVRTLLDSNHVQPTEA